MAGIEMMTPLTFEFARSVFTFTYWIIEKHTYISLMYKDSLVNVYS